MKNSYRTLSGAVLKRKYLIESGEFQDGEIKIARLEILPD